VNSHKSHKRGTDESSNKILKCQTRTHFLHTTCITCGGQTSHWLQQGPLQHLFKGSHLTAQSLG